MIYDLRQNRTGSVLFITLIIAGILGLTLGSYLYWVRTQNLMVAESQAWNAALAAAEAGVEEGMAHLNSTFGTNIDRSSDGWTDNGGYYGPVGRTMLQGSQTNGSYSAIISADFLPSVTATGYTIVPSISQPIARVVQVDTASAPTFGGAITALKNIGFNGNNILVDSYDSADPNYSTAGQYDPAKRTAHGDVCSTEGLIDVQNATVKGKLRTGPTGSYNVGPQGSVGNTNWTSNGLQPGWWANDFNMDFPDVVLPGRTWLVPSPGKGSTYTLGGFSYKIEGDLVLKAGDVMNVSGNATLYVTGNVLMQSQGQGNSFKTSAINIVPGNNFKIYVGGASATFTQINGAGNPNNFQYYGLPSNTSVSWGGNAAYVGTVYAPQATFTLGGGGNNTFDFQGGCVVKQVTMNGHFNFHYDENLKRAGPWSGFRVTSWRELPRT